MNCANCLNVERFAQSLIATVQGAIDFLSIDDLTAFYKTLLFEYERMFDKLDTQQLKIFVHLRNIVAETLRLEAFLKQTNKDLSDIVAVINKITADYAQFKLTDKKL